MAWESRGNRRYLYRKKRVNGRVVSEYIGTGLIAEYTTQLDKVERLTKQYQRLEFDDMRSRHCEIDSTIDDIGDKLQVLIDAALLVSGHHTHKRQWRKKRGYNRNS